LASGTIDLASHDPSDVASIAATAMIGAVRAIGNLNRAYWEMLMRIYGWSRTA
jgi:hypothetical protein